jgi:hypothetical protein
MRQSFYWLLGATLALSAVALWVPQRATTLVQAVEARRTVQTTVESAVHSTGRSARPLPTALERVVVVEPARRDPFADAPQATAAPPRSKDSPVAVVTPALPVPPASPPPLQWRVMGTMTTPTGQRLIVLTHANEQHPTVVAEVGLRLDGGYEITAVATDAVRLLYPPLQTEVVIPIPPPQAPDR